MNTEMSRELEAGELGARLGFSEEHLHTASSAASRTASLHVPSPPPPSPTVFADHLALYAAMGHPSRIQRACTWTLWTRAGSRKRSAKPSPSCRRASAGQSERWVIILRFALFGELHS